ncbi:hypothetical protein F5Y08DRAFT_346693 [Xylaria arbuscula]|nr:hypothetical protein F5Y08DRAFT_346693 [Xylaria arbuscula]
MEQDDRKPDPLILQRDNEYEHELQQAGLEVEKSLKSLDREFRHVWAEEGYRVHEDNVLRQKYHHERRAHLQEITRLQRKFHRYEQWVLKQQAPLTQVIDNLSSQRSTLLRKMQRAKDQYEIKVVEVRRKYKKNTGNQPLRSPRAATIEHGRDQPLLQLQELHTGEVYGVTWVNGHCYPGILLPLGDFDEIGMCGSISLVLRSYPGPPCYRYHGDRIIGWYRGYEEGGSLFNERQYPFLLLDEEAFTVPPAGVDFQPPNTANYYWCTGDKISKMDQTTEANMIHRFKNPMIQFRERLQATWEWRAIPVLNTSLVSETPICGADQTDQKGIQLNRLRATARSAITSTDSRSAKLEGAREQTI